MKFKFLYLLPLILILLPSELFVPFDTQAVGNSYTKFMLKLSKITPFLALIYTLFNIHHLRKLHLFFYLMPLTYFIFLAFESFYHYGSFVEYPHVFLKITNLFVAFAVYIFYKKNYETNLTMLMNLILVMLFVRIALDPSIISMASFVSHSRALHAPSIYLLLVPCIYFFNVYLVEFDNKALVKFLILFFCIIYFQHRTVWAATSITFLFNLFLLKRQNTLNVSRSVPTIFLLVLVLVAAFSLVLTYLPHAVVAKLGENITNIIDPDSDTTGTKGWRLLQYESYWSYVKEHFLEGMRLKGFELPIQFYHPEAGVPYFDDGTGHHFHSFYYDILFYFGVIGLIMFLILLIHPLYVVLKNKLTIDQRHLSLISYSFSGMFFGVSYNLPDEYWAIYGLALAYLEVSRRNFKEELNKGYDIDSPKVKEKELSLQE